MNDRLEQLLKQAESLVKTITEKEQEIAPIKEMLEGLKVQIEKEFSVAGVKEYSSASGFEAKWVDRVTKGKFDMEAIMKKFNVDSLDEYKKPDKTSSYIKFKK